MPGARQLLSIIAVAGLGALAGFLGYRSSQFHRRSESILTPAPAVATTAASGSATPSKSAVPDELPDLQLPDISGNRKSLRSYLGHPLIVNFWATWCAPCRREIPLLQRLRISYRGEGLEIVGIAVDFQQAVADYVATTPISYPLLIGEDEGMAAAEQFGMQPVLPFSAFVDAHGRIVAVKIGELHQDEADYILQQMRSLAAGSHSMADTRAAIAERLRELSVARARAGDRNS